MAILINFFDNVILQAISEEIVPKVSFFKDRYFPTGAGDIFKANEVLTEYRSGDRKLAAFVDQKAGDIPIGRRSYEVHSYKPAYIAPSRLLTLDELTKRGFGEALYPGMDEAQRAARLLADDMNDMENRIARREEWMAAETMIGNGCVMQEYIDGATKGDSLVVKFYDGTSDHTYTASKKWNENGGDFWGDVKAMCRMLSARGLPAKDLILGTDVADYILTDERTRQLLDKNSGIIVGEIRQQLTQYDGVVFMGTLNFGGFMLNVFTDPKLDGKPVMVLAVKGENPDSCTYSFLSMAALVDTYKAKAVGKDASTTVTIAGYEVDVKVNVSAAAGNALTLKDDGLYVPTPEEVDISGKADKVTGATTGNLAALDGEGNLTDSGKKPADFVAAEAGKRLMTDAEGEKLAGVSEGATKTAASSTNGNVNIDGKEVVVYTEPENVLHDEDVEDFSAEEIAALLAD